MSYMIIENNFPRWYGNGQGIESHWSNFSLTNSNIEGNIGNQAGGGMRLYNSNPIITDVQIDDNTALDGDCFGGGIHMESSNPIFTNVTINNNMAQSENGECMGGGVWAESSAPVFINVEICNNQAWTRGGGIVLQGQGLSEGPRPILNNVIISGNISRQGGGILLEDSGPIFNNVIISNNAAEGYHDGSAIYCDAICSPILNNATITNNYVTSEENGVALVLKSFEDAPILITNSIIWNDGISEIYINDWDEEESFVYVMYSDIQYGWEGEGNIDSDPLLNDDFTLQANSPCIDAGTADLDGDGQNDITDYYGEAPDIGAFEFEGSTTIPGDVNGDGLLNILDVVALVNIVLGYADPVDSGDLNGDGSLNVLDVVALVEIILNP